ncbi:MAG: hypothetical protein P8Y60_20920 [Calditrichota bacterium]
MKTKLLLISSLVIFVFGILWAQTNPVNFSGEWSLNTDQSTASSNRFLPATLRVTQSGNTLSLERIYSRENQGDFVMSENLTLDGKENKSDTQYSSRISTAKWNGNALAKQLWSTRKRISYKSERENGLIHFSLSRLGGSEEMTH